MFCIRLYKSLFYDYLRTLYVFILLVGFLWLKAINDHQRCRHFLKPNNLISNSNKTMTLHHYEIK